MRFTTVVETSNAVAATSSRKEKVALLAECLAGLPEAETRAGVGFLAGEPRQRPLGVGWAMLRELPPPADEPSLEVTDVDAAFDHVAALSGSGSAAARRAAVDDLFGRATAPEQAFLRALITGEVRQGALRAVAADAIAAAFGMKQADVRRALMLLGDPGETAAIAREQGAEGLRRGRAPGRQAGAADARRDGARPGRRARADPAGGGRVEAGRRPHPGAPRRRGRGRVHPQPGRRHQPRAGDRRGRAGAAGDVDRA